MNIPPTVTTQEIEQFTAQPEAIVEAQPEAIVEAQPEIVSVEILDPATIPAVVQELSRLLKARAETNVVRTDALATDRTVWADGFSSVAQRSKSACDAQVAERAHNAAEAALTDFFGKAETRDQLWAIVNI